MTHEERVAYSEFLKGFALRGIDIIYNRHHYANMSIDDFQREQLLSHKSLSAEETNAIVSSLKKQLQMKEPSGGQKFITGVFSFFSKNYQNVWSLEEILQILTNKEYLVSAQEINAYLGNIIH